MKLLFYLFFFLIVNKGYSIASLDSVRQLQLDSIVTNIPKEIRKDLYLLQGYLHKQGYNNEERVWMYFAIFPIYIRYEEKRMYTRKPKYYTPEYVINKGRGVCRDLSSTFQKLCQLSNIPCIQVVGKTPFRIIPFIKSLLHFVIPTTRHAWCVVRIKGRWMLMDPTWAKVKEIKKYYKLDRDGNKKTIGKCKVVDRSYYDTNPYLCARYHKPFHAAFYLMNEVPAYKSSFKDSYKKPNKRKLFSESYNYKSELDSLYDNLHPEFSKLMEYGAKEYSGKGSGSYFLLNKMAYHNRMIPRAYKPNLQNYYCHFEELDSLNIYLNKETNYDITSELEAYKYLIDSLYIKKLEHKTRNRIKLK